MSAHLLTRMARGEKGLVWVPTEKKRRAPEVGWKVGASRLGIPFEDYRAHIEAGELWCTGHKAWEPLADFGTDRKVKDGRAGQCRRAAREYIARRSAS